MASPSATRVADPDAARDTPIVVRVGKRPFSAIDGAARRAVARRIESPGGVHEHGRVVVVAQRVGAGAGGSGAAGAGGGLVGSIARDEEIH